MKKIIPLLLALFAGPAFSGAFGVVPNVGLVITNANISGTGNENAGLKGTLLIRGFSTLHGNIHVENTTTCSPGPTCNTFDTFLAPDLVSVDDGATIAANYNVISSLSLPYFVSGSISINNNAPLASVYLPRLTTTSCDHIYLAHTANLLTASFPSLTTMRGALSFAQDTALASFSAPLLSVMNHQLEFQSSALTSLSLPALTSITGNAATTPWYNLCTSPQVPGILAGNSASLASVSLPLLATLLGQLDFYNTAITDLPLPALTTFGPSASVNVKNAKLSVTNVSNLLIAINTARGANTCTNAGNGQITCVINTQYQHPAATPNAAGLAAKAALIAAGYVVTTD